MKKLWIFVIAFAVLFTGCASTKHQDRVYNNEDDYYVTKHKTAYKKSTCMVDKKYILGIKSISYTDIKNIITEHKDFKNVTEIYGEPIAIPVMNTDTTVACYGVSTVRRLETTEHQYIPDDLKNSEYIKEFMPEHIQCITFVDDKAINSYESNMISKERLIPQIRTEKVKESCVVPKDSLVKIFDTARFQNDLTKAKKLDEDADKSTVTAVITGTSILLALIMLIAL